MGGGSSGSVTVGLPGTEPTLALWPIRLAGSVLHEDHAQARPGRETAHAVPASDSGNVRYGTWTEPSAISCR